VSKDPDDLEQSIFLFTEAIFLPLPWDRRCYNIIQILSSLALALALRGYNSRQLEDVTRSVIYLRYLRGQPLEAFGVPRNPVTKMLAYALGLQAEMKLGDVRQNIEEMAVLCHELLKSDISMTSATVYITKLAQTVVNPRLGRMNEPCDKVIECLREANIRIPYSFDVSIALASSLFDRFRIAHSNDDYEEATTILDKFIEAPGEKLTPHQERASVLVSLFAFGRSLMFKNPEYSEQAIHRNRNLLAKLPPEHSLRSNVMTAVASLRRHRLDGSVVQSDIEEARLKLSAVFDRPSFQELTASLTELGADSEPGLEHFDALFSINRITDAAEIEEAVKYCRLLAASSHHGSVLTDLAGLTSYRLLFRAFSRTNKIEYLNEGISVLRLTMDNFDTRGSLTTKFFLMRDLISSLYIRLDLLLLRDDANEIIQLFPMAVNDERANVPDRFELSCDWAHIAHGIGHPRALAGYDTAISLMQDSLTFSPTLDAQHSRLVAERDRYENLPLDYASYHVSTGQLRRAIETLERGRALIWSEMRGLRSSIDQIRAIDSHLGDKFAEVNRDLETLTLTISANNSDNIRDDGTVGMDLFGRLVMRQRELLDDRNELISQIQALPGLETFLKPPSFDNLRSSAARGPVIVINHSRMRSDILILHHDFPPFLIPTAPDFYDRATNLRDQLLGARKDGLDSSEYEEALSFVLKELYELVGRPVIQRLNELSVPKQSRIW
jgi:tetratricopeptide (TPR) repeat protein